MGIGEFLTGGVVEGYSNLVNIIPNNFKIIPPLFIISVVIAVYGMFVWVFYRFLARRDVLKLNLQKYNKYKHSGLMKTVRTILYILEFMIISPIAIFFWFAGLSVMMIVLAKEMAVGTIILICAALISAVRIVSYLNEDASKELAKLIPLTLLGIVLLSPTILNIETSIERISQVPLFLDTSLYYFLFIFCLEIVLRLFLLPVQILSSVKVEEDAQEKTPPNKKI